MDRICAALALSVAVAAGGAALAGQEDSRLEPLFEELLAARSHPAAAHVEERIWSIWLESGDPGLDRRMARGIQAMNTGDFRTALVEFDAIVEASPSFAEGWNKRATLYWLMGEAEASVRDIDRTLALEPRHFGALSGLALIREAQGRPFEALEALEKVVRIHPQLPHLQERIDQLSSELGEAI